MVIFCIFPACGKSRNDHYRRNGKLNAGERPVNAISLYSSALANSEAYYSHCIYQYKGSKPLFNKECLKKLRYANSSAAAPLYILCKPSDCIFENEFTTSPAANGTRAGRYTAHGFSGAFISLAAVRYLPARKQTAEYITAAAANMGICKSYKG